MAGVGENAIPYRRRRGRRRLRLVGGAVVVAAALAAFLVIRSEGPGPVSYEQMTIGNGGNAQLEGTWSAPDGVNITFSNPRSLADSPGGDFSFRSPSSGLLNWTRAADLNGTGMWTLSDVAAGKQAAIDLEFGCDTSYGFSCPSEEQKIVLLVKGDAADPVFVCQSPTDADPCILSKSSSLRLSRH